eukprot:GILJ01011344.1.p1 GENE.GILJ01011344.1~~GILJ01011344.1.p1  ORF type:complete len:328 (+),score=31.64 GILJ01011344.1:30-986(+)
MMRKLPSMVDVSSLMGQSFNTGSMIFAQSQRASIDAFVILARSVSSLMKTSSGRDKLCAVFQYWAGVYSACTPDAQSAAIADQVEDALSSGRKIFRLLKFLDDVEKIRTVVTQEKAQPLGMRIISILCHVCSFNYYLLDNLIWIDSMGLFGPRDRKRRKQWKRWRNANSLGRTAFAILVDVWIIWQSWRREKRLFLQLQQLGCCRDAQVGILLEKINSLYTTRAIQVLDHFSNLTRLAMLTNRLKIYPFSQLSRPFVASCGVIGSLLRILIKSLSSKDTPSPTTVISSADTVTKRIERTLSASPGRSTRPQSSSKVDS